MKNEAEVMQKHFVVGRGGRKPVIGQELVNYLFVVLAWVYLKYKCDLLEWYRDGTQVLIGCVVPSPTL